MNQKKVLGLSAALACLGGLALSAQAQIGGPAISHPPREFGASITPAYEGWFDNPDGSHNFLIGYYNRNTKEVLDIPIGPNNRFDTKDDMGQPTHFLTRRRYGYFVVTVPKEFTKTQKISWTLTANGATTTIPFQLHVDYNISPFKASEESPNKDFNKPPRIRFAEAPSAPSSFGPMATGLKPLVERKATAGQPMPVELWIDDDALYASGSSAPPRPNEEIVEIEITKYRGPGTVTVKDQPKLTVSKGGKPLEPYSAKATGSIVFSAPGDYLVHLHTLDYSGKGGAGTGCCWTTAVMKVAVN
ncbi:MAG: hypothetical protein AB7N65_12025 [Vicinamibacterales bacterium]